MYQGNVSVKPFHADDWRASVSLCLRGVPGNRGPDPAGKGSVQAHEDPEASKHLSLCGWTGGELGSCSAVNKGALS